MESTSESKEQKWEGDAEPGAQSCRGCAGPTAAAEDNVCGGKMGAEHAGRSLGPGLCGGAVQRREAG